MYRIFHFLFGWQYAAVEYGSDWVTRRIRWDGDGRAYVHVWDEHIFLNDQEQWHPLTCSTYHVSNVR
jgi:hypothetical protein